MKHIDWIRRFAFTLWDSNQITDDDYDKVRFHLVKLEKLVKAKKKTKR